MAVKFLSDEWAQALKTELNASDSFKEAATGKTATIQQVISGGGDEIHYWISLADGAIDMGIGDADTPDATITESYEVAVALAKSTTRKTLPRSCQMLRATTGAPLKPV